MAPASTRVDPRRFTRIHVTGNAGAGKTGFARRLAAVTGLPLHHLDPIVWRAGWRKARRMDRRRAEARLVEDAGWIIEGVSPRVRAAAELVIWLDVPTEVCLARARRRAQRLGRRTRPELPPRCPEIAILARLPRIVAGFAAQRRALLREHRAAPGRVLRIRDGRALDALLGGCRAPPW